MKNLVQKTLVMTAVLGMSLVLSPGAQARQFKGTATGGGGRSVSSAGSAQTTAKRGEGVNNTSSHALTGPRGKTSSVDHSGDTSYNKGEGVTHTGDTAVTTANGKTKTANVQSNTVKTDTGVQTSVSGY